MIPDNSRLLGVLRSFLVIGINPNNTKKYLAQIPVGTFPISLKKLMGTVPVGMVPDKEGRRIRDKD